MHKELCLCILGCEVGTSGNEKQSAGDSVNLIHQKNHTTV